MTSIALAVTEGMSLFEIAIPSAVFGLPRPQAATRWYDLRVCSAPGATVGTWFRVSTPHGLDELARADTIVVPACDDAIESTPTELVEAVKDAHARGVRVASICTGAFVLAAAGLLDGRRATTHWLYAQRLAERFPGVELDPSVLYVDDGDVLTSAGQAAGIDLCLHMVRNDHGAAIANTLARWLVASPHRDGGQAQFIANALPRVDGYGLASLRDWARNHLHEPLSVADLARRASMSPRHLSRRFVTETGLSPLQWLLAQRIQRAQELLETTNDGVERIAERVGIGTATTLRRHFTRTVGVSPGAYRRQFRDDPTR